MSTLSPLIDAGIAMSPAGGTEPARYAVNLKFSGVRRLR
jgi:hypothetical protein